jgi:hypothetical protein
MQARDFRMLAVWMLTVCGALCASGATAADAAAAGAGAGLVTDTWIFWPKDGQALKFEAAVKEHAAWRKNAGEGFTWSVYQPVVGRDLSFYVIRTRGHHWQDFDANEEWTVKSKARDVFTQKLGPYIARMEHYFGEYDLDNSHYTDSDDYKYFYVNEMHVELGSRAEVMTALSTIHKALVDEKWPYSYLIEWTVGGKESMNLIVPMKGYADLADPNPSVRQVLTKTLGSQGAAAAVVRQFNRAFDDALATVYVFRPTSRRPNSERTLAQGRI